MENQSPTSMQFLIGVDGGGTQTRACIARMDGRVLGCGEAGPSGLGQGIDQAWTHVRLAVDRAFRSAGIDGWDPRACAIGLGLAGAIVPSRHRAFIEAAGPFARLGLASDGYTLLLGAHGGGPGAIVAAGTGSIGEALRRNGEHVVIGGWGYPVGDEGGGAWLGMQAVREAQRALDARSPAGPLVLAVLRATGTDRDGVLAWCERAGQRAYAALAPLVFEAAAADARAATLLDDAARALDGIALSLDPDGALPLVVAGSIGTRLAPRLSPGVRARIVEPAGDAMAGALRLIGMHLERAGASA